MLKSFYSPTTRLCWQQKGDPLLMQTETLHLLDFFRGREQGTEEGQGAVLTRGGTCWRQDSQQMKS